MSTKFTISKLAELFRGAKADAVPKPPRSGPEAVNEPVIEDYCDNDDSDHTEVIITEVDDDTEKKPSTKKPFFKPKKKKDDSNPKEKKNKSKDSNAFYTEAGAGNAITIVNSSGVHLGDDVVYNISYGHKNKETRTKHQADDEEDEDEYIEKDNLILLLLESNMKPNHKHLQYTSRNLGKKWKSFFRYLGYSKGEIETFEHDHSKHGIAEVRYQIMLDWIRNDEKGTLGCLANHLWEHGEREVVKGLSLLYSGSKK